jgi:hypothetical protein
MTNTAAEVDAFLTVLEREVGALRSLPPRARRAAEVAASS